MMEPPWSGCTWSSARRCAPPFEQDPRANRHSPHLIIVVAVESYRVVCLSLIAFIIDHKVSITFGGPTLMAGKFPRVPRADEPEY